MSTYISRKNFSEDSAPLQNEIKTYDASKTRLRRQTMPFHGKFRGQTQSQYMNTPSPNSQQGEGKAEAGATLQSSHATVSE